MIIINKGKVVAEDRPENLATESAQRMLLRINGNAQTIEQELSRVAGIKGVEREQAPGEANGFIVVLEDEKQGRQGIQAMIERNKFELVEMRLLEVSLEDIFIKLVTKEEA